MIMHETGYLTKENGTWKHFHYFIKDHLGNNRLVVNQSGAIVQSLQYEPFGMTFADGINAGWQPYKFGGKEEETDCRLNWYDFESRLYVPDLGRFMQPDSMAEKYYSISPYAYCANNPINRIDKNGKEWDYVTDKNGHTTINLRLNFSVSGNYTAEQISAYKNAISTQFNSTISESSGETISGAITFYEGNADIIQSLSLGKMNDNIGGMTSYFQSYVNLYNSAGESRSLSEIGSDATHEVLHTLRLEHPFEVTQTVDTKLLRVGPNSFVSTPTTDKNIVNNVMSYPMITIDGAKSSNQTSLTKGQLNFMINEIGLQKQGYGFVPKYNSTLSPQQNANLYKKYYENYWLNTPGTPVTNK